MGKRLYTAKEAALVLGMPATTFDWWRARRQLPKPSTQIGNLPRKYYTEDDLKECRRRMRTKGRVGKYKRYKRSEQTVENEQQKNKDRPTA